LVSTTSGALPKADRARARDAIAHARANLIFLLVADEIESARPVVPAGASRLR
jgi:hypothetical protein